MNPIRMTDKNLPLNIRSAARKDFEEISLEMYIRKLAELSRGLAHPARVEIVRILANKPQDARCVCGDIVNALPLAQSSVSQHLKILKETGWIRGEVDGPYVCYCIVEGIVGYYQSLLQRCIGNR